MELFWDEYLSAGLFMTHLASDILGGISGLLPFTTPDMPDKSGLKSNLISQGCNTFGGPLGFKVSCQVVVRRITLSTLRVMAPI